MSETKKALVTAAGPNMMPLLECYSLPTFQRFADAHGYVIHVENLAEDDLARKSERAKAARWSKIGLLRKALETNDVALWLDADVMLCTYDEDVADCLEPTAFQGLVLHSVPAESRTNPNTGVWLMRRDPRSTAFLDEVEKIGLLPGRWADQGAVLRALGWELGDERYHGARMPERSTASIDDTTWLPVGWNQPYCDDRTNPEAYTGRPMVDRPNAVHFMAMTIEERHYSMSKFARSLPSATLGLGE